MGCGFFLFVDDLIIILGLCITYIALCLMPYAVCMRKCHIFALKVPSFAVRPHFFSLLFFILFALVQWLVSSLFLFFLHQYDYGTLSEFFFLCVVVVVSVASIIIKMRNNHTNLILLFARALVPFWFTCQAFWHSTAEKREFVLCQRSSKLERVFLEFVELVFHTYLLQ